MGAKQSGNQTVTQQPDALTQQWRQQVLGMGLGALGLPSVAPQQRNDLFGRPTTVPGTGVTAFGPKLQDVPGLDPRTQEAIANYQGMAQAGNLGLGALSGDQAAIGQLWNPYQSGVLDAVKGQWGDLAANTTNTINDQATKAGAFGGTRQGVAQGVALGQLNKDMGNQLAGLQYQGFNDAMGRAGQLANFGMGANSQLASLGDYARQVQMSQDPAMRNLQIMQGLMTGMPFGTTTSQPTYRNPLGGALGGAAAGSAFGPWGAGIGGLIGLLGG